MTEHKALFQAIGKCFYRAAAQPPPSAGKSPVLMSKSETGGKKMKTRYFNNVECIEELKKRYFALAKLYHSDITGGSD